MTTIAPATLKFLKNLEKHNDREWFNAHKQSYLDALQNMQEFIDDLIREMNKHDELENVSGKKSLYRIYGDARFGKDKSPYRPRFVSSLHRATKLRRGGYYLVIKPGASYMACGFWGPNPADLSRIRQDIDLNHDQWNKILRSKGIASNFGPMGGEKILTAPRGYSTDHPGIEFLRHKQFILRHDFSDKEVLAPGFLKEVDRRFKTVRPYLNHMSEVLTTDLNGELII